MHGIDCICKITRFITCLALGFARLPAIWISSSLTLTVEELGIHSRVLHTTRLGHHGMMSVPRPKAYFLVSGFLFSLVMPLGITHPTSLGVASIAGIVY